MENIISRSDALKQGLKTYTAKKPCKRNHPPIRYSSNGVCVACKLEFSRQEDQRIKNQLRTRRWKLANAERTKEINKRSREKHLDKYKQSSANYYQKNKEAIKAKNKKHYENNKGDYFVRSKRRSVALNHRGFSHERKAINEFYKNRPEGHHVDHIIPINHPDVCGLHCLANLQYLTAEENLAKGNSFSDE